MKGTADTPVDVLATWVCATVVDIFATGVGPGNLAASVTLNGQNQTASHYSHKRQHSIRRKPSRPFKCALDHCHGRCDHGHDGRDHDLGYIHGRGHDRGHDDRSRDLDRNHGHDDGSHDRNYAHGDGPNHRSGDDDGDATTSNRTDRKGGNSTMVALLLVLPACREQLMPMQEKQQTL